MNIRDLSEKQINQLVEAIEADGFENVVYNGTYISFSKFPREYEMYTTNIHSNFNDMSFQIILQEEKFFESGVIPKKDKETDQYKLSYDKFVNNLNLKESQKVRHSVSLDQSKDDDTDIEIAIGAIPGWTLVNAYYFSSFESIYSKPETSDVFLSLIIKGKEHFALDHGKGESLFCVYEGSPDLFLSLVKAHPETFFDAPNLNKVLGDIKMEIADL